MGSVISPDGQNLATLGYDETLRIWNLFEKIEEEEVKEVEEEE